jgi:hypothetical protein
MAGQRRTTRVAAAMAGQPRHRCLLRRAVTASLRGEAFSKKCYVAKMLLEIVGSKMLNERMLDGKMLSIF